MKILLVCPYFAPHTGGVENYALNIARLLKKDHGLEIAVITTNHSGRKYTEEEIEGMKVYRLAPQFKVSNTPIGFSWQKEIRDIISREKPDVINAHIPVPFLADIASREARQIPFILTYHNDLTKENPLLEGLCRLYYLLLGNRTLGVSKRIITTSMYYAKRSPYLAKHLSKVRIVPPGVDLARFNTEGKHGRDGCQPKLLFVGQLSKTHAHKGLNYLIDAIALLRDQVPAVALTIIGKGDRISFFKQYALEKGVQENITFAGFVPDENLPGYYQEADMLVLPSYTDSEGFGMVLIEAMACRTAVIGSAVGGIPYVISDHRTGLLVPPKDSMALARAILLLAKDKNLCDTLAENGYNKVQASFDWAKIASLTNDIYNEAVASL